MEVHFAIRTYKSCAIGCGLNDFRNDRRNNGKNGPKFRRWRSLPYNHAYYIWPVVGDVIDGWRALAFVVYNQTSSLACSLIGDCLGGSAFASRSGMGIVCDLAVFRFLMLVFIMAETLMVACNTNHIGHTCVSKRPAYRRGNRQSLDYRPVFRSSSSRSFNPAEYVRLRFFL
jgi:hypothetical protein